MVSVELAKAMWQAGGNARDWDQMVLSAEKGYMSGMIADEIEAVRIMARAAFDYLGITPEQAERMEKGAVGKVAAHLLRRTRECDESATCAACIDRDLCDNYQCLKALGAEVSHG